jgi:thymidylate kinase
MTEFISLNGPDNAGKTTQLGLLSEARPSLHVLGSVHEHAPDLWGALPAEFSTWWFKTSSTAELTELLLESHRLRAEARRPGSVAVIDRGYSMLMATAVATCVVKDGMSLSDAWATLLRLQRSAEAPPPEFALLLLISRDAEESLTVSQQRDPVAWSPRYLRYQRILHEVVMQQAEQGAYDQVIEWGTRSRREIHREVLGVVDGALGDAT